MLIAVEVLNTNVEKDDGWRYFCFLNDFKEKGRKCADVVDES